MSLDVNSSAVLTQSMSVYYCVLFFKHVKGIVSFSVFKAFYGYLLFIFGISMLRHVPIL